MWKKSIAIPLVAVLFVAIAIPAMLTIYINNNSMRQNSENAISESVFNTLQANQEYTDRLFMDYIYQALDFILAKEYAPISDVRSYQALNSDYENVLIAMKMNDAFKNLVDRDPLIHSTLFLFDGADYVVSTDRNISRMGAYGDMSWLSEAIQSIQGARGIWVPRTVDASPNAAGAPLELISYVYRTSSLYTTSKVTVVINLFEEQVSRLIWPDADMLGGGFLMTGQGDVIAHSDKASLHTNISQTPVVTKILTGGTGGILRDTDRIYVHQRSNLYDWVYVNEYPTDSIFAQSTQIVQLGMVMTLVILLVSVTVAVFFSLRFSRPVRRLAHEVKALTAVESQASHESGNELAYISGALRQIKAQQEALTHTAAENAESMQWRTVSSLLYGEPLSDQQVRLLEELFPFSHFAVSALVIDDYTNYRHATPHAARELHRRLILEFFKASSQESFRYYGIRYSASILCAVMNIKAYDSTRVHEELQGTMKRLIAVFQKEASGRSLTIGVSSVHSHLSGIQACLDEAISAAGKRLLTGRGKLIFHRQAPEDAAQIYPYYPHQGRLMNFLARNDLEKIEGELDALMSSIRAFPNSSIENVMLVYNQILGATLVYLNEQHYHIGGIVKERSANLYTGMAACETIDEITVFLKQLYAQIIAHQLRDLQAEPMDLSEQIQRYIRAHYAEDIDFEAMSAEIGISYSYARRIMKEGIGMSMIDYLNQVRIKEAKRLLDSGSKSAAEISAMVGYYSVQSLYRFFKKYEGISPSEYRAKHGETPQV
jgi:AraC-like DNA-binding protein